MNVIITSKMTRMNIHDGVYLEVITMHYSKITGMDVHERMH